MSCGVGRRCGSDPALLCLWRRLAATALIRPLALEPPYAAKRKKKETSLARVLVVTQWLTNPTKSHEVACSIPGLAQWVKDLVLP